MMLATGLGFALLSVVNVPPAAPLRRPTQQLLSWSAGTVSCDGVAVDGAGVLRPSVEMAYLDPQRLTATSYRFAIDTAGRTHSIAGNSIEFLPVGQDLGPALAASRFPAGAKHDNCLISYTPKLDRLATAPIADVAEYSIYPSGPKLPQEGWDRFGTAGNCREDPRPSTLLRAYPDFSKVAATPGVRDWSLVSYDTDAEGRPINARTVQGTGNAELDAAAIDAVRASRFTGGARTGCFYPYWRSAGKFAAPQTPAEGQLRPANATCPAKLEWTARPKTSYPPAYRKRAIEGWAIVTFDTAPWGEVGNVKVLDAQPAADFGQRAILIVRSGRVAPSAEGASGCIETVRFAMSAQNTQTEEGDDFLND
jgi:TonB family protein